MNTILYIILYIVVAFALSVFTDGAFNDLLEKLGDRFRLPKNIVAATFMAMASSGPELFSSVVDTFYFKNHIGIGTIIGSAIFNILIIVAMSGFFAKETLVLDYRNIMRDVGFYLLVILVLILGNLGGYNTPWNMWTLISTYLYYLGYLFYQTRRARDVESKANINSYPSKKQWSTLVTVLKAKKKFKQSLKKDIVINIQEENTQNTQVNTKTLSCPKYISPKCILGAILEGFDSFFRFTISEKYLALGFIVCLIWIILFTYTLVLCCTKFASDLGWDPLLTGLLILAPTTSLPDAMASIAQAKEGEGDSAVVNAISSNIFDIAIGHGLPQFILTLMNGKVHFALDKTGIRSYIALGISLFLFVSILVISKWKLHWINSLALLFTYLVYVVIEIYFNRIS